MSLHSNMFSLNGAPHVFMILISVFLPLICAPCADAHIHKSHLAGISVTNAVSQYDKSVHIKASQTVLSSSGQWVDVSWSGVSNPSIQDWIAVYSPASNALRPDQFAPIKYKFSNQSSTFRNGYGKLSFFLLNMRADVAFAFMRKGLDHPNVVSISDPVVFTNLNEPLYPHVSLTKRSPHEMRVSWTSFNTELPQVKYGLEPGQYTFAVFAESVTYIAEDMCSEPASSYGWHDPGLQHHAVLTGLQPRRKYYYIMGSDRTGWSREFFLRSPPAIGIESTVKFFTFADYGKGEKDGSQEHWVDDATLATTKFIKEDLSEYDLLLLSGDVSYAVGYLSQWDEFMAQISPISSMIPFQTGVGNHERIGLTYGPTLYDTGDSGGECGVPYSMRFPRPSGSVDDRPWYSFDLGPVHVLMISSEHDFLPGTAQFDFIYHDLESVQREVTPWLIVTGHRPLYLSSTWPADQSDAQRLRDVFEELFFRHKVDVAIFGHNHTYQRMKAVYKGVPIAIPDSTGYKSPIYMVIGSGGCELTPNLEEQPPIYLEKGLVTWGYGRVEASASVLRFEFVLDKDGSVADEFTLTKSSRDIAIA